MNFLERLQAVLHHQKPDQVPFAPYHNLVPRGEFERLLRNRGMGLCYRTSTIWSEIEGVSVEQRQEGDASVTIYHTPVGQVSTRSRQHIGRISDDGSLQVEGMIKGRADYDPVIYMLEATRFHCDPSIYTNAVRDWGADGIVRDTALDMESVPYGSTRRYYGDAYGLENWIYAQRDDPDHFRALLAAQERRDERRLALVADSPAELVAFGWLEALWSAETFRQHELPFYQKWVPHLQSQGKLCVLHCDATKNLGYYADLIAQTGVAVVEAVPPPPVGGLSLPELRAAWGHARTIWLNFPETIFWSGRQATFDYTAALLHSDPALHSLVIGFTEMGVWGATDSASETAFKEGTLAIMDAIAAYESC
jgi:hypothetical protein